MTDERPPLALIAGPTASGKSALAIALAEATNGVIVNADASQVYRDLRIITARPSAEDEMHVDHRLYGHIDGAVAWSAAAWAKEARATIAAIHAAGRLPILTGGTGLYIRTLLDGIAPVPAIDPAIRLAVRALPVAEAHAVLQREDAPAAARLSVADTARVARALEVVRATGRPLAAWQAERVGGIAQDVTLQPIVVMPERATLFARIDARLSAMFDTGAIEEVARLLHRDGVPRDAPIRRAIGVPDIARLLDGAASRDAALDAARLATRRYAKRQYTWFRHQLPAEWPRVSHPDLAQLKYYFNLSP